MPGRSLAKRGGVVLSVFRPAPACYVLALSPAAALAAPVTIGSPLLQRPASDTDAGEVYVYTGLTQPFPQAGFVSSWSFFDNRNAERWVTPLIFVINGNGTYTVAGVGTSQRSTGNGAQTYPFGLIAGSNALLPDRYTFGFTDRVYTTTANGRLSAGPFNTGVIQFTGPGVYSDPWQATSYGSTGGPITVSLGLTVGGPGLQFDFTNAGRIYSAQATETPALPGDANLDGKVDFSDLLALAQHYGMRGNWPEGDFDGSGTVAFADLLLLAQNYGQSVDTSGTAPATDSASATPVPEPTGLALVGCWGLALRRRRRR